MFRRGMPVAFSLVLLLLSLLATATCAISEQRSRVVHPHDVCRSSHVELQDLTLARLEEHPHPETLLSDGSKPQGTVFQHAPLLSVQQVQEGVSNSGNLGGLQRVLQKLLDGKGITAVALGGSVSAGHGLDDPANGWISRVFAWIETAFPAARHRLLNRAIPAVTSGYVSACVPDLLPPDVDLVLLEFTYNDWVFNGGSLDVNTPARRGLERLLRRLVVHPSAPSLLYLHYWPAARPAPPSAAEEALVDVVLGYYGVPTLSLRAALNEQLAATPELLELLWKPAPDTRIHPTCVGARIMADLMIGHLQQLAANLLNTTSHLRLLDEVPPAAPAFLLDGNWGHLHSACVLENELPSLALSAEGWNWTDEGRTKQQHKWGYISSHSDARLELQVPLERVRGIPKNSQHFLVGIGGLISYQHMGRMVVACSGGCSCPAMQHDMFHAQKFSMTGWRYVNVTRTSTERCSVVVANTPETSTGEHKLKVSSLMMSAFGEASDRNGGMLSKATTNLNSSRSATESIWALNEISRGDEQPGSSIASRSRNSSGSDVDPVADSSTLRVRGEGMQRPSHRSSNVHAVQRKAHKLPL